MSLLRYEVFFFQSKKTFFDTKVFNSVLFLFELNFDIEKKKWDANVEPLRFAVFVAINRRE